MKRNSLKFKVLIGLYIGFASSSIVFLGISLRTQISYLMSLEGYEDKVELYAHSILELNYLVLGMVVFFYILGLYLILGGGGRSR